MKKGKLIGIIFSVALILVIITTIIGLFFITGMTIKGTGMAPTLEDGKVVWADKLSITKGYKPERGDIVSIIPPTIEKNEPVEIGEYKEVNGWFEKLEEQEVLYVKRVIGLPGEHIVVNKDEVYINDTLLTEEYINKDSKIAMNLDVDMTIPEGYIFVMGDNRSNSKDSRYFGAVPIEKVTAKIMK